jgi:hypothetical protein
VVLHPVLAHFQLCRMYKASVLVKTGSFWSLPMSLGYTASVQETSPRSHTTARRSLGYSRLAPGFRWITVRLNASIDLPLNLFRPYLLQLLVISFFLLFILLVLFFQSLYCLLKFFSLCSSPTHADYTRPSGRNLCLCIPR